jgi:hypothetical protein
VQAYPDLGLVFAVVGAVSVVPQGYIASREKGGGKDSRALGRHDAE